MPISPSSDDLHAAPAIGGRFDGQFLVYDPNKGRQEIGGEVYWLCRLRDAPGSGGKGRSLLVVSEKNGKPDLGKATRIATERMKRV